jgi:hypothetical protein
MISSLLQQQPFVKENMIIGTIRSGISYQMRDIYTPLLKRCFKIITISEIPKGIGE